MTLTSTVYLVMRSLSLALAGGHHPVARAVLLALMIVTLLWLFLARAVAVHAAGVVTDCSNDAQLRSMLTAGGAVTFNCNGNHSPAVIVVNPAIALGEGTYSLDGGNKVTLSGANTNRIFYISTGGLGTLYFTLSHIVLTNGYDASGGGCLYSSFATRVLLDDVTVQNCLTQTSGLGGGIAHEFSNLILKDSRVLSNTAGSGGGVISYGSLIVDNTLLRGNRAVTGSGGGLEVYLTGVITGSTIYENSAMQNGGGIHAHTTANVSVFGSQMHGNSANTDGGAIANEGTLTLTQTSLMDNRALENGGAIRSVTGTLSLFSSTLSTNLAANAGAGVHNSVGTALLTNVTLDGNLANYGGGLYNHRGVTTLHNVTLSANQAYGDGYGGGLNNYLGTATLTNVTVSGNSAGDLGGGLLNLEGIATLNNVTLSRNSADFGGGIAQIGNLPTQTLTLRNTIVANSPLGGNCYQSPASVPPIASNNFNLSDDDSCTTFFNQTGDVTGTDKDPNLSPLGNHGGYTPTHVPFPPSKAVDGGGGCSSPDQRGVSRPKGVACDIGAVEYVPGEKAPWLWLPFIRR